MAKKEETYVMVSLDQEKAKKLAQVISNDTSRKLLDYLSKKEGTETEIAVALGLPLSTVHYNLKNLCENGLVKVDEFHYSEKGKEVNHYSLVNKLIIIVPRGVEGLSLKIQRIAPIALLAAAATLAISILSQSPHTDRLMSAGGALPAPEAAVMKAADLSMQACQPCLQEPSQALWFLAGSLFALAAYLAWDIARERIRK